MSRGKTTTDPRTTRTPAAGWQCPHCDTKTPGTVRVSGLVLTACCFTPVTT